MKIVSVTIANDPQAVRVVLRLASSRDGGKEGQSGNEAGDPGRELHVCRERKERKRDEVSLKRMERDK